MANLSGKARELLEFFREDYKKDGYLYSGSWSYEALIERGYSKETIVELEAAEKIHRRHCKAYAFELSLAERGALITNHSLCSSWFEEAGRGLLPEIQNEVRDIADVAEVPSEQGKGLVSVRTMRPAGRDDRPDRVEVPCSFSVGQVVDLEYDLPKKTCYSGYAHQGSIPGGKAVGSFMVTDIIHNLLVYPGVNLLEVQSLCEEFNKLYPQERTMMVFEDVLLKRMKEHDRSLEEKLESAAERSSAVGSRVSDREMEKLWEELTDVPIDEEECLDVDWRDWPKGTHREEIWHWFDENHSKGVAWLMYEYESEPVQNREMGFDV